MTTYIVRRLAAAIPVLVGIAMVIFGISHAIPGDAAQVYLGTSVSPQALRLLRVKFGLNQPLPVQFFDWFMQVLHGNLGHSLTLGTPVLTLLENRGSVTLELTLLSMLLAFVIGVPFGVFAAAHRNRWIDKLITGVTLVGLAIPDFWLGTMLALVFALELSWLPSLGFTPLARGIGPNLLDLILPCVSLAAGLTAVIVRFTRTSMLDALGQDFIRTAAAKGLHRPAILFRHALKNAFIPVLTVMGIQVGYLLGGAVVIEDIFALPGLGRLALTAINQRDYPTLQATVLWFAVVFVLVNLVVDLLYGLVDPRTRYE